MGRSGKCSWQLFEPFWGFPGRLLTPFWAILGPSGSNMSPSEAQRREQQSLNPREPQEGRRGFQHVPKRVLRWPQSAYETLPERTIAKVLILTPVVVGIVVVFALFFIVVVPFVLPCSSREYRRITPDNQCTSQK